MSDEIKDLIDKSKRSISAAEKMISDGHFDFSVSRAYYAMFYITEALLLTKKLAFSKHSAVVAAFGEHFIKTSILPSELHANLRLAFDKRAKGDYSLSKVEEGEALDIINKAKDFIDNIEQFLNNLK